MDEQTLDKLFNHIKNQTGRPFDAIDQFAKDGQLDSLMALAQCIADDWQDIPERHWKYSSCYTRILENLSLTAGQSYVETLFDVLRLKPPLHIHLFEIATQLASTQDMAVLDHIIPATTPEYEELWVQLIQDAVIRGQDVTAYPNMMALWDKCQSGKHPLTALPLTLFKPEAGLSRYVKSYRVGSAGVVIPAVVSYDAKNKSKPTRTVNTVNFTEIVDSDSRTMMSRAIDNWEQYSGGVIEARQFKTSHPVTVDTLLQTDLLRQLGLDCLQNISPTDFVIEHSTAKHIAEILFSAAANGAAYNRGVGSAYARLYMWQSLAALMYLPEDTPIAEISEQTSTCDWMVFEAESKWFAQVAWDIGIVGIHGDVISILAATDTD